MMRSCWMLVAAMVPPGVADGVHGCCSTSSHGHTASQGTQPDGSIDRSVFSPHGGLPGLVAERNDPMTTLPPPPAPGPTGRPGPHQGLDLSEIALALHESADSEQTVERVAEFARSAVGCDDAGVLLVQARNRIETAAATSGPVARAHDLQVELDEGPCLDALENRDTIYQIEDLTFDDRWPRWGAAVLELGYRSVVSVPLATAARRYGSLNVYASRPHAFDEDDVAVASILARHASLALAS
ncbi:MAG: GAF domain-containing protein, partial [Actinomycetales bacterium]